MIIGSFNVRKKYFEKSLDDEKQMDEIISFMKNNDLSIFSVQELNISDKKYLEKNLKEYKIYGYSKENIGANNGYNCIIMKKKFTRVQSKTYALSKNIEDVGSKSFINLFPKNCTVIHFRYEGKKYMMINTHFSLLNKKKELEALDEIVMREKKKDELLILTGNFNMKITEKIKWFIVQNGLMIVKYDNKRKECGKISNILLSKGINVLFKKIVDFNEIRISKCSPVIVRISVKD